MAPRPVVLKKMNTYWFIKWFDPVKIISSEDHHIIIILNYFHCVSGRVDHRYIITNIFKKK